MKIRSVVSTLCVLAIFPLLGGASGSGGCAPTQTSNDKMRDAQERMVAESNSQIGMPALTNFREKRMMKEIMEKRDQDGLVTYTYFYSTQTGKFTFVCDSMGYGLPYATQFTAAESVQRYYLAPGGGQSNQSWGTEKLPQADPNGLFIPQSADGTWVYCLDPANKRPEVQYLEEKVNTFTYKLPDNLLNH